MGNRLIFVFVLALSVLQVQGQVSFNKNLRATISGRLALDGHRFEVVESNFPADVANELQYLRSVSTDAVGNVMIEVKLPEISGQEYYKLEFSAIVGDRTYPIQPEWLSQHILQHVRRGQAVGITWYNPFDNIPFQVGVFGIELNASFYSRDYPCPTDPPVFDWQKQRNHVIAAAAGTAMIGIAQFGVMPGADDQYRLYKEAIFQSSGTEPVTSGEATEEYLDTARDRQRSANQLTVAGSAILAGSAVTYVIRWLGVRKKHKEWGKYCGNTQPSITLTPFSETGVQGTSLGMTLAIHF